MADIVTLRAVEHFDSILPAAANLVAPGGLLALLVGESQLERARQLTPGFLWSPPAKVARFYEQGSDHRKERIKLITKITEVEWDRAWNTGYPNRQGLIGLVVGCNCGNIDSRVKLSVTGHAVTTAVNMDKP